MPNERSTSSRAPGAPRIRRVASELVVDFQQLVEGQGGPEVSDDVERVATEGAAVQLLTMHKSKGLEAEVVVPTILRRLPAMQLAGPPEFTPHLFFRVMHRLPVRRGT